MPKTGKPVAVIPAISATARSFADLTLAAIIDITATRLALVVVMIKHARLSNATARTGVVGLRISRGEIRHGRIMQEKGRNFNGSYVSRNF